MTEDSGLWKRGMLVFGMIATLAAVVLFILLYRSGGQGASEDLRPETLAPLVATPAVAFPGTLSWGALYHLSQTLPSAPGWEVRYQATLAQVRRGSPKVRLEVLGEMLDEQRQMRNFRLLVGGRNVADEEAAHQTLLGALRALTEWHKHTDAVAALGASNSELQKVYAAVDRLARSSNRVVSAEAEKTRLALKRA